ncbi:adenylate/guanylate cyclase domain-containing protein [Bradyrhizobium sp. CCBAU 051011]|uniref:adenylate/guanylate cyclase domain-containing protein n=1 Tax=Bradyrhizobium sp. CCBAU 051011 TaxID=858422 RepID=UPI001373C5F9|nr:adenylate/guanylate cyclase domain-containing protein [Bradyrhizobium sp. CCBAU 051011]QHO74007.1 adenylate/guanylate cyclase domain-containing protein [Bradyrhizobium sp. CCBAU 051011]
MADFAMPETRYALSGDINIAYQTMGHGPLDIVIVPGAISHVEFHHELPGLTAFLHHLSRFARVVTFDKRGQGLSDRVSGVPSLEERMDDVRAVMDAISSKRAVLLGFSEGCPMSVLFAATYPERVSHLVLVGGFVRAGRSVSDEAFEALVAAKVAAWGTGLSMKRVIGTHDGNAREIALLGKLERLSCSPGAFKTLMLMNRRIDVTSVLPSVRVPALVLHSRADAVVPIAEGRKLAAAIPGAKYIEYGDLPHGACFAEACEGLIGDIEEFVTGHRDASFPETDRVLATVLFTDIVDSTRMAVEVGDQRWHELLDRHDRLAKQTVEKHRGNFVKSTGDGILATFDGPGRAVRCALAFGAAAQQMGLPLRAGLHTGEIELRGRDVGGIAVHAAARVMAQCGANEVLVSRVVTDLVAGAGLKFTERGAFDLKGIPGRWELFAAAQ